MKLLLKGGRLFSSGRFSRGDVLLDGGVVSGVRPEIPASEGVRIVDLTDCILIPGLVDVHVHLREPGFLYKETIETGTLAAARGGFTHICPMPNVNPVPDSLEPLEMQLRRIREGARVRVTPYGALTVGEKGEALADMEPMAPFVAAFSDDGRGVQNAELMKAAMVEARRLGKIVAAHCEDDALAAGGVIHRGGYALRHGHRGIPSESEWRPIARDLLLAEETGCRYHICHVSAKESVELIRRAKARGVDVSCETAPHYLLLNDSMLRDDGRFKMNPPIRAEEDREALIEGLLDGTIDMIATDHAPHADFEKDRGLAGSLMGVVGLETAFPTLYTGLVRPGILTLEKLIELMHFNPARRFGLDTAGDFAAFDLKKKYTIDPADFRSKGRATPFAGREVQGECKMTIVGGQIAWDTTGNS
ncbi:MAG: dihydroorotase [Clostridiales bacterium]|nr:dihydroorotase [Clostridiales bacterium]